MIQVTFPDGNIKEFENGTSPLQMAASIGSRLANAVTGALVDGKPWDLTRPVETNCTLKLFTFNDVEGREVFRHSSTHLMAQAVKALFPEAKLTVGPPLEDRFYYDIELPSLSETDFPKIEAKMKELATANFPIEREEVSRERARELFADDRYKLELIEDIPEDAPLTIYKQGDWFDLCRGPHLPSTGKIKAFKLLSVAGAYWRGDPENTQLQRLYGTSYPSQKELDEHMTRLEEAKARDHRKLGRELGLFVLSPEVGSGLPLWTPKGNAIRHSLETFIRGELVKRGYQMVVTPHIASTQLFITSGHMEAYKDSMFPTMTSDDGDQFVLKPVNCPFHIQIYAAEPRSYRDLPLRYAEFGTVYRWELSGEVGGLTRVRGFTQDDAHLFLRPDQLVAEFKNNVELVLLVLGRLGLSYTARVGLRDPKSDKYVGSDEAWQQSQDALLEAVRELNMEHTVAEGEAAIYGPKLDFIVKDAIGRSWQLGTVQVDYVLPERFNLEYTGSDGKKHRPVMIHRAPFGSLERFIGVLIEHFAGAFPLWLAPVQIKLIPIADRHHEYAKMVEMRLQNAGFRVETNAENEKMGQKIAIAETQKIPYMAVIGDKEIENDSVSLRARGRQDLGTISLDDLLAKLQAEAIA
ncbi:threonyl-tRNA synthetase [Abditibacterium utsteinense]|uniref:Threonine--tRNA ligase n=1 Tax=Abditibacterium utsteinense TaxID=1960156 RepID=A0A2S8SV72_9BACT|nr:threonine--tRNA ligase [Abditibacterium utsteinense]PQV64679.1 threonyl-tRNA synthetase [Abditibacterium utsteinense]